MYPLPHTKPNLFVEKVYIFLFPPQGGVGGSRGGTPSPQGAWLPGPLMLYLAIIKKHNMENKTGKRGRPKGSGKKEETKKVVFELSTEGKKRGRKKIEKIEVAPVTEALEVEVEGTTTDKLKGLSAQLKGLDVKLNDEPYRMELRVKKNEVIARMCYLIETL